MDKIAAVVLAAGKGTRMVSDKVKVLHTVCGKPLLHYVIRSLQAVGVESIYAVVGYQSDEVEDAFKGESVFWVNHGDQRGTAHALSVTESMLNDWDGLLLVLCGDTPLLTPELLRKFIAKHKENKDTVATVLTTVLDDPNAYGRIIRDENGNVTAIVENAEADKSQKEIKEINSGAYVFNPDEVFRALKRVKPNKKNGEYYLTDVIKILASEGKQVAGYIAPAPEECLGVNTRDDLFNANKIMSGRIMNELMRKGVTIVYPANTYIETDVSIGRDTVIYPFTVINSGVVIGKNCEVGPFSHLRSGTVLADYAEVGNFTETKKTHLGRHSKAKHLSYLGDAIIGDDVNIGAGTITANYDGKKKHQTVIEDGASTGSGTILVAPVKMGKNAETGAGAVVPKGKNVPDNTTVVGIPAVPLKKGKGTTDKRR